MQIRLGKVGGIVSLAADVLEIGNLAASGWMQSPGAAVGMLGLAYGIRSALHEQSQPK